MEGFLFLMFIAGIVMIVTTTIAISKIKYRVNSLQKQVTDLSTRLEKTIRNHEKAPKSSTEEPIENLMAQTPINKFEVDKTSGIVDENITHQPEPTLTPVIEQVESKALRQPPKSLRKLERLPSSNQTKTGLKETELTQAVVIKDKPKSNLFTIESIISKLGILLLLIGIGFMYRLAYDKGYVTPTLVIFFGYIFGLVVLIIGLRVRRKNREVLSQVLFGGGVAILYITTFAAYQGYGLMQGFLAFLILFAITFLSFFIALSINSMAMSIIALLGSLLTPFAVGLDVLGLYGTGVYILFISIGSMIIYVFKRWRLLQLTSIVGINLITLLLTSEGNFSSKETVEFSILLVAILLVFYGVEYVHYYLGRDYAKELFLTAAIISALPILTLFQVLMVLDMSAEAWALVFAIVSLIFFILNYSLYKKRQHSLITDILMSYIGLFVLVGIILYFGGEVRYIAILILSVIFTIIYSKSKYLLTRLIGLIIYVIGFVWAFIDLLDQVFMEEINLIGIVIRLIVMTLITFTAVMEKDVIRKVLGGLAFQLYFFIAIMSMVLIWTESILDETVMFLLVFGVLNVFFIWLNKKFKLLSIHAIVIISILPFILKLTESSYVISDDRVDWIQTIAFVLYGIDMYILSLTMLKNNAKYLVFILKLIGYGMLTSIILVELPVWSHHFGYGIALLACMILIINYVEDHKDQLMNILILIYKIGFIAIFVIYTLSSIAYGDFNVLHFIVDLIILIALYYFIRDFIKDERILFVINAFMYMLVIYQNLNLGENGTVTLFWAAYGILSLAYFLVKGKRKLVYFALGMIVLVAAKFILIDLSTIEMIWKIITSMAFGAALLILSYVIQPLLDKYEKVE